MKPRLLLIVLFVISIVVTDNTAFGENVVTVFYNRDIGKVNKKVFGNNIKGRDPLQSGYLPNKSSANFGSGVWDPKWNKPYKEVVDLAKNAGVSIVRYAIGNHWDWHNAIGRDREHLLFGLDEFMETIGEIGAEPVIIVSPLFGDETDAADLVEYLNASADGSNINGGVDWADVRSRNGHAESYHVTYFQIGNEVYTGHVGMSSQLYVNRYLKYYDAMKAVDPSIKIGFVLPPTLWHSWFDRGKVLAQIKDKLDYGELHRYYPVRRNGALENISEEDIYKIMLALPKLQIEYDIPGYLDLLKKETGKDIPLAITEYSTFSNNNQHRSMGSALLSAELLKIFMKPEHNILMANHWHMANGTFGMVRLNKAFAHLVSNTNKIPLHYIKRPTYYVFELYNKHFGDILVETEVQSDYYDISDYSFYPELVKKYWLDRFSSSPDTKIPYLSVNASRSNDGKKLYVMVINKNTVDAEMSIMNIRGFLPLEKADSWILNGPDVSANNEMRYNKVKLTKKSIRVNNNSFKVTFEPHSLTAFEIKKKE